MAQLSITCGATSTSSGVLTIVDHENIDSLVHNLSEDTYTEIIRNGSGSVTDVNTLTNLAGTNVRKVSVARDANGVVTGTVDIQYNPAGVEIQRLITTITRNGAGTVVSVTTDEVP